MIAMLLAAFLGQEFDRILERADKLLEEAKSSYETARSTSSVAAFVDAGFKLEEARIKYLVLQEIGEGAQQKLASDRLRAVNQLGKLIHDGKVAITGAAAKPEGSPPAEAPAPKAPAAPPPAALPSPDVTKRFAVPDAAKQKEAEKVVRDVFKAEYGKKAPADRKAFARMLLEYAARSADDAASLWVLYREALEMSILGCEVACLSEAVEGTARYFDVDATPMKSAALAAAGKNARTTDELASIATLLLMLVEEFIRADQYEAAEKAATSAVQFAKAAKETDLIGRTTVRQKEASEAKSLYASSKSVLQRIAKNPDDPAANLEMGKFLCFVKGTWDLGLRFIAKGSEPDLRALAERELAKPAQSADLAALADGWWELAEKEKSNLRKTQIMTHCGGLYEASLPGATALNRLRIQKRLDALGALYTPAQGFDLLRLIDPKLDGVKGKWTLESNGLTCVGNEFSRIQIPYVMPAEYDLVYNIERLNHGDFLVLGLVSESTAFGAVIDAAGKSLLERVDGLGDNATNPTIGKGLSFPTGRAVTIKVVVRKTGVTVTADNTLLISYQGPLRRLSPNPDWSVPGGKLPYIGSWHGGFRIQSVNLIPVGDPGKRYR
jgi:hypothetical protein